MQTQSLASAVFCFACLTAAQINLEPIDTASACSGKGLAASATFSTATSIETGSQRIPGGDFWTQQGAQWVFDTNTSGIQFSNPAIPGAGTGSDDTPQINKDALKLDDSKTKWTLIAPTVSGALQKDIVFQATSPTAAAPTDAGVATTPAATTTAAPIVAGVKFRRQAEASFNLIITGVVGCSNGGIAGPIASSTSGVIGNSNPTQASLCSNAGISTNAAAWTAYGVDDYFSSILSEAAPAPTAPQVNAADLLKNEVGAADNCGYTAKCDPITCALVKDASSGSDLVIQKYEAYSAYVNLNNFFYTIYNELFQASESSAIASSEIVNLFFTNPPPDATWNLLLGTITPLIGILSAGLGVIGVAVASGVAAGVQGIFSEAAGIQAANASPVMDKRFTQQADVTKFMQDYLKVTYRSIIGAYQATIGNASASSWFSSENGNKPLMAGGGWTEHWYTDDFANTMVDDFSRVVNFRMINYLWNASDTFVIYVPYETQVKKLDGSMGTVSPTDCENYRADDPWLVCDAEGGMARFFNANNGGDTLSTKSPQGATSGFDVGISTKIALDAALITKGCVNSWLKGDFGYTIESGFSDLLQGDLSAESATALGGLQITQDAAGWFNLPVCQVWDLRSFPPAAKGNDRYGNSACGCISKSAVGGMQGSTARFMDHVSSKLLKYVKPNCQSTAGGRGFTCPENNDAAGHCATDIYPGFFNS